MGIAANWKAGCFTHGLQHNPVLKPQTNLYAERDKGQQDQVKRDKKQFSSLPNPKIPLPLSQNTLSQIS